MPDFPLLGLKVYRIGSIKSRAGVIFMAVLSVRLRILRIEVYKINVWASIFFLIIFATNCELLEPKNYSVSVFASENGVLCIFEEKFIIGSHGKYEWGFATVFYPLPEVVSVPKAFSILVFKRSEAAYNFVSFRHA